VWEEVIIHLPVDIKLVSLSATLSNAEEFADWMQTIRGATHVILEHERPVEIQHHYLVDGALYPMFTWEGDEPAPNPQIRLLESRSNWDRPARKGQPPRKGRPVKRRFPRRADLAELLDAEEKLPAIYFIFSRKGCDAAVQQCLRAGVSLTNTKERREIRKFAEARTAYLDHNDPDILGYDEWIEALTAGVAAHHAGLIPVFKETVEELFKGGLVKLVFATETLALGINMPAKTVLIESLNKFTGERHEMLTPGQFTQLTGRAGRRGIDVVGHAVVPQQPDIPFRQIAGLALTRTYPLISSFQPSYNMATNLVRNYSREEAEHLLNSSFAQYRTDKDVVVVEQLVDRNEAYLASYREKMHCDKGDFEDYWRLRETYHRLSLSVKAREAEHSRNQIEKALATIGPGEVWQVRTSRINGNVVMVSTEPTQKGGTRAVALTDTSRIVKVGANELREPPHPVGTLKLDKESWATLRARSGSRLDHALRRKLAGALKEFDRNGGRSKTSAPALMDEDVELALARTAMLQHPCHSCPDRDRHAQWAERAARMARENEVLHKKVLSKTETLSRRFERILGILEEYHYLDGFNLTGKGWSLARIYNENDLLVTETLARGWLDDLEPAELAALLCVFVYESRGPVEVAGPLPTSATKRTYGKIARLEERMKRSEMRAGLEMIRGTETGFAMTVYRWCLGDPLEDVIDEDSSPGDFIRSTKQTIDLLRQVQGAAEDEELRRRLTGAIEGLNRGVVAYSGVAW
ncbi:MAG TPA: helicase-related protein, partial [Actinomycetota bacterium]|nr:helicase-related protein [Actinomycetota bacterium]